MNKQVLVFLLALIFSIFTFEGYRNVVITDNNITLELHKTYDLTHELGLCYVWYDIEISNILNKYIENPKDKDNIIALITAGKNSCHSHLYSYVKTSKTYEADHLDLLHKQDADIDLFIDDIILNINANNIKEVKEKIPQVYNITRPILYTINYTIATRSRFIDSLNENIQEDNKHIKDYLLNTFIMSFVLFMASMMKLSQDKPIHSHKNTINTTI